MALKLADAFWNNGSNPGFYTHLHFIISDPVKNDYVLIVNATSWESIYCDESCILDAGDHPRIKHKSYVDYSLTKLVSVVNLMTLVDSSMITIVEPVSTELLNRIQSGLLKTDNCKEKYQAFLRDQGFTPV